MREKGQAIFEFLIFLPLMLGVYATTMSIGDSINGAINQQKLARGYFFSRIKWNSYAPRIDDIDSRPWVSTGMYFVGWTETMKGGATGDPIAPCYPMKMVLSPAASSEECDEPYSSTTTRFIRVRTVFGLCTTTYRADGNEWMIDPMLGAVYSGCTIKAN